MTHDPQTSSGRFTQLPARWVRPARVAWCLAAGLLIITWAIGSYHLLLSPMPDCTEVVCDFIEFSAQDSRILGELGLPAVINARVWTAVLVFPSLFFFAMGGVIVWRKSQDWMGLLVAFTLVYVAAVLFTSSDDVVRRSHPALVPLLLVGDAVGVSSLMVLFLTFPNGRIVPPWAGKALALLLAMTLGSPLLLLSSTRLQGPTVPPLVTLIWLLVFLAMIGVGFYAQIHRYRRVSTGEERQRTKWVVFGLSGALVVVPLWTYIGFAFPPSEPSPTRVILLLIGTPVFLLFTSLFPLSLAISILRYRLFDIDRLINRTLVYGALTGSLGAVFYGGVVFSQFVVWALTGSEIGAPQPLVLVLATLGAAGLFSPLRRRIQSSIDRRFYRRKYDADRIVSDFASTAREEVDLDTLIDELVRQVGDAVQPTFVSTWFAREKT